MFSWSHRRVVVTGAGVLAPNGCGLQVFWEALLQGKSGIGPITQFDTSGFSVKIAGEIKGFDISDYLNGQFKPKRLGRHTQLALAATHMALQHAGLPYEELGPLAPIPIVIGVSSSAFDVIEKGKERLAQSGPDRVSSYLVAASQPHAIANAVSEIIAVETQNTTVASACPAGLQAIATACDVVRSGKADLAIAGGADAPVTPLAVAGFGASGMVPNSDNVPDWARASCPFDLRRRGGVLSEGSGIVVLETLEHALARGATPRLEITGYASTVDRRGDRAGTGFHDSMLMALANAGHRPEDIDYICAHGPSDPVLDAVETASIKSVFGRRAYAIPVSSIKGCTGNPLSAAGPLELATSLMVLMHQIVPPTANYQEPDPACDLDYVPEGPRPTPVDRVLINVHGLGGVNSTLVVERVRDA